MQLLTGYTKPIIALALTPDGAHLFSAADGQTMIWEWDLSTAKVARKIKCSFAKRGIDVLAMSSRGDFFVSAASGRGVGYMPLDGREPRQLDVAQVADDHLSFYPGLAIHPHLPLVAASFHRKCEGFGFQTWNLAEDDRNTIHTGHESYVSSVQFSRDGKLIATASQDGTVRLWPVTGGGSHMLPVRVRPTQVAFHPNSKRLAATGGRSVFVFGVDGKLQAELKGHGGTVNALAYSPDGQHLASAGSDGVVILRDAATNEIIGQRHLEIGKLTALVWRADSSKLIVGGEKLIAICERAELRGKQEKKTRGEPLSLEGPGDKIQGLSYSPDGKTLLCWNNDPCWRFWDLSGGAGQAKEPTEPYFNISSADAVSWSPDSVRLAATKANAFLGVQRLGDLSSGERKYIRVTNLAVAHFAFTRTGHLLFVITPPKKAARDWTSLELRDTDGQEVVFTKRLEPPEPQVNITRSISSSDGKRIYAAASKDGVYRWTPATGEVVRVIKQNAVITVLEVSDDERRALTVAGNTAHLWTLPEGKKLAEYKHPLLCSGAAMLPSGRVITGCYDGLIRVWDGGGNEMQTLDLGMGSISAFAVAPDHMTCAAGVQKKNRIVLMDVPD